jgi:hypothetical protein
MALENIQEGEQFRAPGIVRALDFIGVLSTAGGVLLQGAWFDQEYAIGLIGIGGIVNGVIMAGFAAAIRNLAQIAWQSEKARWQREALISQSRENAKALQWLIQNSASTPKNAD